MPATRASAGAEVVQVTLGKVTRDRLPEVGLGMPAEEIDSSIAAIDLLARAAPKLLICAFDRREKHGRKELDGYRVLCEKTGAQCVLEVVVESVAGFTAELAQVASLVRGAGLTLSGVALCPVGDLKVLPGSTRPPPAAGGRVRPPATHFPACDLAAACSPSSPS